MWLIRLKNDFCYNYSMFGTKIISLLIGIFCFAVLLRFLYFPNDIYFGYDQAIGSFAVKEILNGHPKLIGPTTTFQGLRHGALYYYLYAPFYLILFALLVFKINF